MNDHENTNILEIIGSIIIAISALFGRLYSEDDENE